MSLIFDNLKALESEQEDAYEPPRPRRGQQQPAPVRQRRLLPWVVGSVSVVVLFGVGRLMFSGGVDEATAPLSASNGNGESVAATSSSSVPVAAASLASAEVAPAQVDSSAAEPLAALSVQWPEAAEVSSSTVATLNVGEASESVHQVMALETDRVGTVSEVITRAEVPAERIDTQPDTSAAAVAATESAPVMATAPVMSSVSSESEPAGTAVIQLTVRDADATDEPSVAGNIEMRVEETPASVPVVAGSHEQVAAPEPEPASEPIQIAQPEPPPQQIAVQAPRASSPIEARTTAAAPPRQSVEALRSHLLLALESGQYAQADQVLAQLHQQLGGDSGFYRRMEAYYLLRSEQLEAAEAAYDAILIHSPDDGDARLNSGWLAMQRGDLNKAGNRLRPLMTDSRYRAQATPLMAEIDRAARLGIQ